MEVEMETYNNISINWEMEIGHANYGRFSIDRSHNIVLSYSQENDDYFHIKSKIVNITEGEITEIFEIKSFLGTPSVDKNGYLYICTYGPVVDGIEEKSVIIKLNPEGKVVWEYLMDAPGGGKPIIYKDSVLVFDFSGNEQCGHLHRIDEKGTLIWKKSFNGNAFFEPQIFKLNEQDSILLHAFDDIFILDMNGNTLRTKNIGRPGNGLWVNKEGRIYAGIYPNFLCLNTNLDIIWEYKPVIGFVAHGVNEDTKGNIYCMLQGRRIVSLDSHGKERWIAQVTGDFGYQPIILAKGEILIVTEQIIGKRAPQIEHDTYLEVYSPDGTKLLKHGLPGGAVGIFQDTDGTILLITHCRRVFRRIFPQNNKVLNSIKVFSINIA